MGRISRPDERSRAHDDRHRHWVSQAARRAAWWLASTLGLAAITAAPAVAQLQIPRPVGYVNDFANVIPPQDEAAIQAVIDEVRAKSGGEIVVVTLPSLDGEVASDVALRIGREWGIGALGQPGDQARNTGSVILVSMRDRKWRVETGEGTNTFVTAAEAGRIGRDLMVPELQAGRPGQGILRAVQGLAQEYAKEFNFTLSNAPPPSVQREPAPEARRRPSGDGGGGGFVLFIILAIILFNVFRGGG
ncbi:MAG TPA: TPM domain-containing protein, partial [Longimicrobium sp.]|nr:TPM domain-containing protein [Longimicrobium sp.]